MTEKDIVLEEQKWEEEKQILERELTLKKEKKELKEKFRNKLSTSKLLILFLFINCTVIEIFTGWVTVQSIFLAANGDMTPDFTPLVTLIGAVVSEVIGFAVYALKSAKENTSGGIVYETAMAALAHSEEDDYIPEEDEEEEAVG